MDEFSGCLRVLELYSGIGGMHFALKESGVEYKIIEAMDTNTTANFVYQYNFPDVNIKASNISKLTIEKLNWLSPNTVLMSPPCQPFTRVGMRKDCLDARVHSFLHILELIYQMECKPEYVLVENVKGFEKSNARDRLIDMLHDCNYYYQEFMLSPLQFGIPNCRMRYYLIAKLKPLELAFWTLDKIVDEVPVEAFPFLRYRKDSDHSFKDSTSAYFLQNGNQSGTTGQMFGTTLPSISATFQALCLPVTARPPVLAQTPTTLSSSQSISQLTVCLKVSEPCAFLNSCVSADNSITCDAPSPHLESNSCKQYNNGMHDTLHECLAERNCDYVAHCCEHYATLLSLSSRKSFVSNTLTSMAHGTSSCQVSCSSHASAKVAVEAALLTLRKKRLLCVQRPYTTQRHAEESREDVSVMLTIAEAGCNMRHCEHGDTLVCSDGTDIKQYLEPGDIEQFNPYTVSDKDLQKFVIMDIVHPSFKKSSCFTRSYGHYIEGTGSMIMKIDDVLAVEKASLLKTKAVQEKNCKYWGEIELDILRGLQLRYFTPREVANLLCFPAEFEIPDTINRIQSYRLLGNSLNVHVVSVLIQLMLMEPGVV